MDGLVISNIIKFLDFNTALNARRVSKTWRHECSKRVIGSQFQSAWDLEQPHMHPCLRGIYSKNRTYVSSLKISDRVRYNSRFNQDGYRDSFNENGTISYQAPNLQNFHAGEGKLLLDNNMDLKIPVKVWRVQFKRTTFLGWYNIVSWWTADNEGRVYNMTKKEF
tara:strand:- start:5776 stop:6270 length:495 start_codon:yes stop_codon:yes gene_type:complete